MPYITPERRQAAKDGIPPFTAGELNYAITQVILDYLGNDITYATLNTVVGALECAKLELYRRVAVPYEDQKCRINGDVY